MFYIVRQQSKFTVWDGHITLEKRGQGRGECVWGGGCYFHINSIQTGKTILAATFLVCLEKKRKKVTFLKRPKFFFFFEVTLTHD